jgi:peptidoglycan/LPS O-acetylase OafA/YrhL
MKENTIYLHGLNGMRSIAALSVLVCHIFYTNIGEIYLIDWPIAHYAVTMFYVISGFLITFLLLR